MTASNRLNTSNKGLSAPALCFIAFILTIALVYIEYQQREVINDGTFIQIDVHDNPSESVDSGNEDDDYDVLAPEPDDSGSVISKSDIKDTVLALSDIDFSKKVLWRIHRIKPLKGFSEKDKNTILFKAAVQLYSNGDYKKTHTLIGKLPRHMRYQERPGFYHALALSKDDKISRAINAYQSHIERFPHHQASAINYGLLLNEAEQYEKAVKAFKYAVNITSSRRKSKSYRNLGIAYYELGQFENAMESFKKAIEYQPNNSTNWLKLAEAQQELPKFTQAKVLETYRKSVALAPNRYTPALKRANYLFSELMFAEAAADYKEARKRSSGIVETALMQSINYLAAGNLDRADKIVSDVKQADNDEKQLLQFVEAISDKDYEDANRLAESIESEKHFQNENLYRYLRLKLAVIEQDQDYLEQLDQDIFEHPVVGWPSQLEYVRGLVLSEQYEKAQAIAASMAKKLSNSAEAHLLNGQLQLHNKQKVAGFNSLKHAYNIHSESRRVAFIYAKENFKFERYDESIRILDTLLQTHMKDIEALELKAQAHHAIGQNEQARAAYTQAFELDDKNLHSAYALARLEADLGNTEQSLLVLKDLLERDSTYLAARELRAKILCASSDYKECLSEAEVILRLDQDNKIAQSLLDKYGHKVESTADVAESAKAKSDDEKVENNDGEDKAKGDK